MEVRVINKSDNDLPSYETIGSAGCDVRSTHGAIIGPGLSTLIKTGLYVEIPVGYEIQVRPRSGLAYKKQITVLNSPGTIDADYRGEIGVILINNAIFPDQTNLVATLGPLFQHIKYYFPRFRVPTTVTLINDVDYQSRVIVASDTLLLLSLDNYLGADHRYYSDIKRYIVENLKASQIPSDVAKAYAQKYIAPPTKNTFLEQMIYFGKQLYLQELWLPNTSDASKIGYTDKQWQWAEDNQVDMWRYFVEKELLFSTDPGLTPRFISNAPFSKFYLELDNESSPMAGRYLGWKIVRAFMKNNDITPQQLLVFDAEALFKKSKYKPKK